MITYVSKGAAGRRLGRCMLSTLLAVMLACTGVAVAPGEAHAAKKSATITVSQVQKHFNGKVGNHALGRKYHHYCLMFVATCWASKLKTEYYSVCCARRYGALNRDSKSMVNIPIGADVFFTGSGTRCPSCRRPAGHVGVYVGDGYMVHSMGGRIRRDKVADIAAVGNLSYYGWGYHEGVKVKADKGKHPRGEVQQVEAGAGEVAVSGWALDDSASKKSVKVKVYIGAPSAGGEEHVISANVKDAEVNEMLGVTGKHRFSATIATNLSGKRTLYFYAVNIGTGNDQLIGKKTVTIKKAPPKLSRPAVKTLKAGKRTVKVTWKATKGVGGYQVRLSTDKSFKENVTTRKAKGTKATTLKVSKLRPGTRYYVQVRTYKKQGGETYYSKWSKAKAVKTTGKSA